MEVSEFSGPSRRALVGALYFVFYTAGMFLLVGVAYVIRPWHHLLLAITVPEFLLYVVFFFVVPESPRWLYANERSEEADKIVRRMAKVNKRTLPEGFVVDVETVDHRGTPLDLVRTPKIRRVTLILSIVWITSGLLYYGLGFSSHTFTSDIFLGTLILCVMELMVSPILLLMLRYLRRIPSMTSSMFLAGLFLLISILFSEDKDKNLTYAFVMSTGKLWIGVVFCALWIYCGECYPTQLRSMGVTITAIPGRISSPIGPYVLLLAMYYEHLPSILFGVLALVVSALILLLPETKDRRLPQSIKEGERFIENNLHNPCLCKKVAPSSESDDDDSESDVKQETQFLPEAVKA